MHNTMTKSNFINEMMDIRPDNFSYDGLKALYEYFEMLEDDCDINY